MNCVPFALAREKSDEQVCGEPVRGTEVITKEEIARAERFQDLGAHLQILTMPIAEREWKPAQSGVGWKNFLLVPGSV
jgi:hypothetical protein